MCNFHYLVKAHWLVDRLIDWLIDLVMADVVGRLLIDWLIDRNFDLFPSAGGFFIAVLQKKATLPWQKYAPLVPTKPPKSKQLNENEPLVPFVTEDPAAWESIRTFFKIHPDFPADQLFVRKTKDKSRHIYLVSSVVKEMLHSNLERMRIVNAGVRIMTRTGVLESVCTYRLAQEGIQVGPKQIREQNLLLQILEEKTTLMLILNKVYSNTCSLC